MDESKKDQGIMVSANLDTTPILYSDSIHMSTNKFGLVLDVMQRLGSTNQVRVVARVGMSREHAKTFCNELSKLLALTEGKRQTNDKEYGQEKI